VEGATPQDAIVYNIGTLYGAWPVAAGAQA
jgi:hypothetical protein